jgi:hypothetical protein
MSSSSEDLGIKFQTRLICLFVNLLCPFLLFSQTNTVTFNYTGANQNWTVPANVFSISVLAAGARGGDALYGGRGAIVSATIPVTPGQILRIRVGERGGLGAGSGGWNGGGHGRDASNSAYRSGGGGGATDIRVSPYGIDDRIVVAAGGGGRGGGGTSAFGASGGCPNGYNDNSTSFGGPGGPAYMLAGGIGGSPWDLFFPNTTPLQAWGQDGLLGQGGNGGFMPSASYSAAYRRGPGGGGGLFGGGGGGADIDHTSSIDYVRGGPGGGGSSLIPNCGTCGTGYYGGNDNHGYVSITYTVNSIPNTIDPLAGNTGPYCNGQIIQLTSIAGASSYCWTGPNGFTSNLQNPTLPSSTINNLSNAGIYTVVVVINNSIHTGTTQVIVNNPVAPSFAAIGPFCAGTVIPVLPTTSLNGIIGLWSPAINNMTTTTYTFTPTVGQCALPTNRTISITPNIMPTFDPVGPFCMGSEIPDLPTTSLNGINGVWSPAISNLATSSYSFVPLAGQCGSQTSLNLTVNPVYTGGVQNEVICQGQSFTFGGTAYTTSGNYPFTFQTINGCDSTVTLNLTVNPVYTGGVQNEVICQGDSFTFGGTAYTTTGNYPFTFQTH